MVKNPPGNAGETRNAGLIPGLERSPEEGLQPASIAEYPPVFLPGKSR